MYSLINLSETFFKKITHSAVLYLKILALPSLWWRKVDFREGTKSENGGSEKANLVLMAFPLGTRLNAVLYSSSMSLPMAEVIVLCQLGKTQK